MEAVEIAIYRRIQFGRPDLIETYGFLEVMDAVEEHASLIGEVEEIGSSDVSCWVKEVERRLSRFRPVDPETKMSYNGLVG